jgi:signal transduction histidine kinase
VIVLTRGEAQKNGVSVQTLFAQDLPFAQGDRVQVQQVMLNLIINAIQAMSDVTGDTRDLHITTSKDVAEGTRVAVQDSGPGLGADSSERLFDSFYTTKPNDMGIGLSICRSIIEAHGGRLWAGPNQRRRVSIHFARIPAGFTFPTARGFKYAHDVSAQRRDMKPSGT